MQHTYLYALVGLNFRVHTETTIISKFKVSKLATHTHNGNADDATHTQRTEADGDPNER